MKRFFAILLAVLTVTSLLVPLTVHAVDPTPDEDSRETTELKTSDGRSTGVVMTKLHFPVSAGKRSNSHIYGKEVISVEADLSNTNVTMAVMSNYNGSSIFNTVRSTADYYDANHEDSELLSLSNGDGFYYISVGGICAGTMVIDGEVWSTNPYSYGATGSSKTTDCSWGGNNDYCLGVTKDNQPLVGLLRYTTTIHNDDTDVDVAAGGINRNTGTGSLVIYNKRFLNSPYYTAIPSYMVVVKVEDTAFTPTNEVKGTVVEIYTENDSYDSRTAKLDDNTIIISGTGNAKIKALKENFSVGDSVTMKTRLRDDMGHTDLFENVNSVIAGHIIVLKDGKIADSGLAANNDVYAVTIAGVTNDGRVALTSFTADEQCHYGGFTMGDICQICLDLGYNTCFFLDGGGSTTMVTKNAGGENVLTSQYVDGYADGNPVERRVGNSVGIVWRETPLCDKQGDIDYLTLNEERLVWVDAKDVLECGDGYMYYPNSNGINYICDEYWDENDVCHYYYSPVNYEAFELPTEAPTEAPTEPPTEAPTEAPTDAPTEAPTAAPTEPVTEPATEPATETPTEAPATETEASGSGCASVSLSVMPVLLGLAYVFGRRKH